MSSFTNKEGGKTFLQFEITENKLIFKTMKLIILAIFITFAYNSRAQAFLYQRTRTGKMQRYGLNRTVFSGLVKQTQGQEYYEYLVGVGFGNCWLNCFFLGVIFFSWEACVSCGNRKLASTLDYGETPISFPCFGFQRISYESFVIVDVFPPDPDCREESGLFSKSKIFNWIYCLKLDDYLNSLRAFFYKIELCNDVFSPLW